MLFGAQNVEVANPAWMSGGFSLGADVVLPYNRIAIIFFAALVVLFVWLLLTRTRLGLYVRAVTQNRTMADCMGIPTPRVDWLTFGLGSGIAGLGGVALSQIGNVGPDLGQSYIIDSFMVVVLGGVGQLAGTLSRPWASARSINFSSLSPEPCSARFSSGHHHSIHSETAPGHVRIERPHRGKLRWTRTLPSEQFYIGVAGPALRSLPRGSSSYSGLRLILPPDNPFYLSDYYVLLLGKIMCYAMVALAMDLIWGYAGILSLGHGLFFALGGYSMGMYLMREIGNEGQYRSFLPDYMVFLDWKEFPWYWAAQNISPWRC